MAGDTSDTVSLEPAVSYESCGACRRCVNQQNLICSECFNARSFGGEDGYRKRIHELTQLRDRLSAQLESSSNRRSLVARQQAAMCEQSLRNAQLRRSLQELLQKSKNASQRLIEARSCCEQVKRCCNLYKEKNATIERELHKLRKKHKQQLASESHVMSTLAKRKQAMCKQLVTNVYCVHEYEHSIVDSRLQLPALATRPGCSLDPVFNVYMALLSASSLVQAIGVCLLAWTPFQPMLHNFLKSPLSRDSITAQHRRLEAALHTLCQLHSVKRTPGDPLLTLAHLVASGRLGQRPPASDKLPKNLPIAYDPHHVMAEWTIPNSATGSAGNSAGSDYDTGDDWVDIQSDFPIPIDQSCTESKAFFSSLLWR